MSSDRSGRPGNHRLARTWPWAVLALAVAPAVWLFVHFEDEPDGEIPAVVRPTFSPRPPAAYRWAEPGDTIDRIGLYAASAAFGLALIGLRLARRDGRPAAPWLAAMGPALAAAWQSATPWPTADGWHGLNWRSAADPATPTVVRIALVAGGIILLGWTIGWAWAARGHWREMAAEGRRRGALGLLAVASIGAAARFAPLPDAEPPGYWARWAFAWGLIAFGLALVRFLPVARPGDRRLAPLSAGALSCGLMIALGIGSIWYHRPIGRLKVVAPGKVYLSAMPTRMGLEVAHRRHGFRTIINVFNEDGPRRSPLLPDELAFAREHGIRYIGSPSDPLQSEAFLDLTLELAQDPDAWPVLLHCHGCMDRSVAWMGIYRFLVQGRPLDEILREIEAHRGLRPKALVTLLYNRVLRPRAPEQYDADPTAAILNRNAAGVVDPYYNDIQAARKRAAREEPALLGRRDDESRRP